MTHDDTPLDTYFDPLSQRERGQLQERKDRYQEQLEAQGYEVSVAEGEHGFFAGVLVIDEDEGRFGFLEDDGSVTWITGGVGGIGALGSAVFQNQSAALEQQVEGLENADVE